MAPTDLLNERGVAANLQSVRGKQKTEQLTVAHSKVKCHKVRYTCVSAVLLSGDSNKGQWL